MYKEERRLGPDGRQLQICTVFTGGLDAVETPELKGGLCGGRRIEWLEPVERGGRHSLCQKGLHLGDEQDDRYYRDSHVGLL